MGRVLTHMKTSLSVSFTLLMSVAALAQSDPPGRVARLNLATGAVSMLSQATGPDWVPAQINFPLTTGDQVWTDFDGRAELHIGASAIRLRPETSATFTLLDDRTVQLQLVAGGLNVHVRNLYEDEVFEVDTPNLAFTIRKPGDYRIDVVGQQTKVIVRSGGGDVYGDGRDFPLRAGDFATVSGYGQLSYTLMSAPGADDFDRWTQERERRPQQSQAARYVSPDTIGAEDLDLYGSWNEVPNIGPVWTPRVDGGWAPYKLGHWAWIEPWGWTWIDDSPWGFAPFHYGRWAYVTGSWGWVPGPRAQRAVYSPALVAWCGGGGGGGLRISASAGLGLAWFALGPGEVYVPSHRASAEYVTRVNVNNTVVNRTVINNVYNNTVVNKTTINNITYVNQTAPGAVVGMSHADMAAGRRGTVPVNVQPTQVTGIAPVPTVRPLMQPMPRGGANAAVARPPAAVATPSRPVIVRNQVPTAAAGRPAFRSAIGGVASPPAVTPAPASVDGPVRRFPARESETIRPAVPTAPQTRPDNPPDRPRRPPVTENNPTLNIPVNPVNPVNPVTRPSERVERPVERTKPASEGVERPQPQPRLERPAAERVERQAPPPERVNRPEVRVEHPAAQPRPEVRQAEPRHVDPPKPAEPPKEEKKKDDKKQ